MRVFAFIVSSLLFTSLWLPTLAEQCGTQGGGAVCPGGLCCSQWGWCGSTIDYCCVGCQSQCNAAICNGGRKAGNLRGGGGDMDEISSEKAFDKMLRQKPFA
ncbi:acidic endochitinase WIN6.2C-like [Manihot esculenta]|uniref:Uncharacterized protein n=2 Tax=Manihot esculenta TaxID=3983 RepID=A0ACB7G147_MANES|nr:acidic endochitinase WIN6.2C-like [Manihot esculenta]XP_043809103.1 acidic endochitinase WIN6.2C-like [Manihot esculenta]XP_043809104.1 acidic endochitinase WIN6.2C-like [Manihot esculenta]KAG8633901.1 hypothetical protein MANES_18G146601v8 [Manihot esculenta]KAG8633902.1 hypothetical protein MANES_18G146701v8 [Manihot esculenta]